MPPLVAIPNISASAQREVTVLSDAVPSEGARVLDVHIDAEHGRSVITCTGAPEALVDAMAALAEKAFSMIDLGGHLGAHPRVGALDVCPFVPHGSPMSEAVAAARETARRIGALGIPAFLYGEASDEGLALPEIRAGGLEALLGRVAAGLKPDEGPWEVDPNKGVVCVGARGVLIAFNVWIDGPPEIARRVASGIRASTEEVPGIRALGLDVSGHGTSQVSMNLVSPETTGIDRAFEEVERRAAAFGSTVVATELVGLIPERFLPDPDAKAARLLIEPGRSLEAALRA